MAYMGFKIYNSKFDLKQGVELSSGKGGGRQNQVLRRVLRTILNRF